VRYSHRFNFTFGNPESVGWSLSEHLIVGVASHLPLLISIKSKC
jgi:hypothetical protein